MKSQANFKKLLGAVLAKAGFVYQDKRWQRRLGEIRQCVYVEKSSYGPRRAIYFGVFYDPATDKSRPNYLRGHIEMCPDLRAAPALDALLDDPEKMPEVAASDILVSELLPITVEFFGQFDTWEKLEAAVRADRGKSRLMVTRDIIDWVRNLDGLPPLEISSAPIVVTVRKATAADFRPGTYRPKEEPDSGGDPG